MEQKYCGNCNQRIAVIPEIELKNKQKISLCLNCYQELSKMGDVPAINELGSEFISDIIVMNKNPKDTKANLRKNKETVSKFSKIDEESTVLKFGKDLTNLAYRNLLDPVIGRTKEVERTILVLSRRTKNNPVLLGEPGVGKTAIAEGLAQRIIDGKVPEGLKDKRVISLNISSIVAGTKYRGEFEDRMKKILEEVAEKGDMILLIDEFHTLIGAGGAEGAVDASNIMKPMLARGELQLIGATTRDEYRKYIEKDAALERRFQPIQVEEPTEEEAYEILKGIKEKYEIYHGVKISEEALKSSVELSNKYISDRYLPDKAIDLMDEASAKKKIEINEKPKELLDLEKKLKQIEKNKEKSIKESNFENTQKYILQEEKFKIKLEKSLEKYNNNKAEAVVDIEDISLVLENWTGVPVNQLNTEEKQQLKELEANIKKYVKGQNEAVEKISKSIRRNKMGLKDPKRPVGVFMLVGPTGVGKTELAKTVAKLVYGKEENMIRFDMSEFMEKHSVSKLIGAPPGYVGYDDEGKLTKILRRKPYSLVLFDEIEKADPNVLNILLQLFEDGRITDSKGRLINAKNAIFLMTSNAGSEVYDSKNKSLGFGTEQKIEDEKIKTKVKEALKLKFKPEFLNRLDDILMFEKLTKETMKEIAVKMLDEIKIMIEVQDMEILFEESYVEHLAEIGFDPEFGARTMRRELDNMKDKLSDYMIENENKKSFIVEYNEEIIIK